MFKMLLISCVAVSSLQAAHSPLIRLLVRKPALQPVAGSSLHTSRLYSSRSNAQRTIWEDAWRSHKEEIIIVGVGAGLAYGGYHFLKWRLVTSLNNDYNDLIKTAGAINSNPVVQIGQTHGTDLDRLTDAIKAIVDGEDTPLVVAFETWKKADAGIDKIFSTLRRISERQERLIKNKNEAPIASFDPSQFEDLSRVQKELRAAMATVKEAPDWLRQVDSNNIKLTKEAAERAEREARYAKSAAHFAAVVSTIAMLESANTNANTKLASKKH